MSGLDGRLARLERQSQPSFGRFILVAGEAGSEAELWAFLATQGVVRGPNDLALDGEPDPAPDGSQLRLLSIIEVTQPIEAILAELD